MERGKMVGEQILVVEDEIIVARNIQNLLENLGFNVPAVVSSGEEAVKKTAEIHPDLVLMDIKLDGDIDGIEAANQIHHSLHAPIVYLTAYADDEILRRAKITEPYGYIIKPLEERELQSNIEIALYKHKMENKLLAFTAFRELPIRKPQRHRGTEKAYKYPSREGQICDLKFVLRLFVSPW